MVYHFLYPWLSELPGFGVVQYITFRAFMALFTALFLFLVLGRPAIRWLASKQYVQTVRDDGPQSHLQKSKTPTMGGVLIAAVVAISLGLWARWDNGLVCVAVAIGFGFALIGFYDDYRKLVLKDANGLRARFKFPLQLLVATIGMLVLFDGLGFDRHLAVPFMKSAAWDLGWWYPAFGVLVVVGTANAVNLTDGLDGLVTVPSVLSFSTYAIFAYLVGHASLAAYLNIPFGAETGLEAGIAGAGELVVIAAAVVGGLLGFLWFNAHPAQIFMGDVGSLPLGAMLGSIAVMTKQELILIVVGGLFVLETLSVIVQVASFKLTGKRVLRMAPLHHHFELKGWPESRVIVRFWIVSIVLALLSLATLKIR